MQTQFEEIGAENWKQWGHKKAPLASDVSFKIHLNRNNCSSFTTFIPNIISYNSYSYSFTCQPFFTARSATGMHPGSPVNHLLSLNVLAHKCLALSLWKISHNQPVAHISTCCFTGSNNFNDLQSKHFKQIIEVTLTFENFH